MNLNRSRSVGQLGGPAAARIFAKKRFDTVYKPCTWLDCWRARAFTLSNFRSCEPVSLLGSVRLLALVITQLHSSTRRKFENSPMAEHILMARSVASEIDMQVVEAAIRLLLRDEGGREFMDGQEYVNVKSNALSPQPKMQAIRHNDYVLSVHPPSCQVEGRCILSISRIFPDLQPARKEAKSTIISHSLLQLSEP